MALFLSSVEKSVKKDTATIKLNANISEEGMKAKNQSMSPNPPPHDLQQRRLSVGIWAKSAVKVFYCQWDANN